MAALNPRTKKLILVLSAFPFMILYIGLVLFVADKVPTHWAIQLLFYIIAGTVWALPLKPVFVWANRPVSDPQNQ